jgi:hypothetical protein
MLRNPGFRLGKDKKKIGILPVGFRYLFVCFFHCHQKQNFTFCQRPFLEADGFLINVLGV